LPVVPQVSERWARQFVHEDDLVRAIELLLRAPLPESYAIFNLAPSDYLTATDIAESLGKRAVKVPAWLLNASLQLLWHVSRGRMPTPPGLINFLRYPINLDGTKITALGFQYRHTSRQTFLVQID
jgi:nucleoside-diphosphate-sugar epimerase